MPNTFVVRPDFLVFGEPVIGADEIDAVVENLRSKWVGTGPRVQEFQTAFAERVGARHAIATNSCTAALHLCMLASGIGAGDEVITTPMTFCATANAILHTGARPVFVDCDYRTGNIDTEQIASKSHRERAQFYRFILPGTRAT
jgi:dTDP-4-amino-4,6-dideoxygalactose transaminase